MLLLLLLEIYRDEWSLSVCFSKERNIATARIWEGIAQCIQNLSAETGEISVNAQKKAWKQPNNFTGKVNVIASVWRCFLSVCDFKLQKCAS